MSQPSVDDQRLFDVLKSAVLTSLPVASAIVFVAVTVKVFRASQMDTATTVAVVQSADVIELLKGVVLTLLPGFLAGVVAVALWWWAEGIVHAFSAIDPDAPSDAERRRAAKKLAGASLSGPRFYLVIAAFVIGFFTIPWVVFVLLLVPLLAIVSFLVSILVTGNVRGTAGEDVPRWIGRSCAVVAAVAVGWLALSPTVWVPLRAVTIKPGESIMVGEQALPPKFSAYVLSSDKDTTSLLVNSHPRIVINVRTSSLRPYQPICVPEPSSNRWLFLRPSQSLHIDRDDGSGYELCPETIQLQEIK